MKWRILGRQGRTTQRDPCLLTGGYQPQIAIRLSRGSSRKLHNVELFPFGSQQCLDKPSAKERRVESGSTLAAKYIKHQEEVVREKFEMWPRKGRSTPIGHGTSIGTKMGML